MAKWHEFLADKSTSVMKVPGGVVLRVYSHNYAITFIPMAMNTANKWIKENCEVKDEDI